MDDNKEMLELMIKMETTNRRQLRATRLQCLFTLIAAGCCVAMLVMIATLLPQIESVLEESETVLSSLETLGSINIDELNRAIANLADAVEPLANFFNAFG